MSSSHIHLNIFEMNTPTHLSGGLWRHPEDRTAHYKDLSYWTDLARVAERGLFDAIFIADGLSIYDEYQGSAEAGLRAGTQIPRNDPSLVVSAMAAVTEHVGFGVTASTLFEYPYQFARRIATLDHLTGGRIGWNIVTAVGDNVQRALDLPPERFVHDRRYDIADEFLEVAYKLWEGSWEDDAVVRDAERNVFTDPAKVHTVRHAGEHFRSEGIFLAEPSPQRTPLLFQAGASNRGREFSARHAEAIFVAAPTRTILKTLVADIRRRLVEQGRAPHSALIYNQHTVITAPTDAEAHRKHEQLLSYVDDEATLVLVSGWIGQDLSKLDLDTPLEAFQSNAVQSLAEAINGTSGDAPWTVRDIARYGGIGGLGPVTVGGPAEAADDLESWIEETGVDGFNLGYAISPGTFVDVADHLVPELQRRGRYPTRPVEGTLRHRLFGQGDRLQAPHPGAGYRYAVPQAA